MFVLVSRWLLSVACAVVLFYSFGDQAMTAGIFRIGLARS